MAEILSTSISGLIAFQRGLATTSHNIANAATEGYTRQRIELSAREPQGFGSGFIGRGVDVTTVRRLLDQFSINQLRVANGELGRLGVFADLAGRIDSVLSDPDNGIGVSMQRFFASVQDVATNPASITARQVMLSQGQMLADQFRSISLRLDQLELDANARIKGQVGEINTLATGIARLNGDIQAQSNGLNGQPPNDLLDQRDRLLNRLSELVNVATVTDESGAINVFIGTGQTLVLRDIASRLDTAANPLDGRRIEVIYQGAGAPQIVTRGITGGELGGLLQFRGEVLDTARQQLGLAATALAMAANEQQAAGFNLYGQFGAAIFAVSAPAVVGDITNTGSALPTAAVADFRALTGDDYVLRFDGAVWSASRGTSGAAVPLTGSGAVGDPLLFEGMAVTIGAGALAGDRFSVRSTRDAAGTLTSVMGDPRGIAAAAPIRSLALDANLAAAPSRAGAVVDPANPALLSHRQHPVPDRDHLLGQRRGLVCLHAGQRHRHQWLDVCRSGARRWWVTSSASSKMYRAAAITVMPCCWLASRCAASWAAATSASVIRSMA